MKVLKSGIEMTPEELEKVKGSGCACGCDTGVDSSWLYGNSKSNGGCGCICLPSSPDDPTQDVAHMAGPAAEYLQ